MKEALGVRITKVPLDGDSGDNWHITHLVFDIQYKGKEKPRHVTVVQEFDGDGNCTRVIYNTIPTHDDTSRTRKMG